VIQNILIQDIFTAKMTSLINRLREISQGLKLLNQPIDIRYKILTDFIIDEVGPDKALKVSARYGSISFLKTLLTKIVISPDLLNKALISAVKGRQLKNVVYLLQLGADDYDEALTTATIVDDIDIVKLLITYTKDVLIAIILAARRGHIDILKVLLSVNTDDILDEVMREAAANNHIDIVLYVLELGAKDFDDAMVYAAKGGHIDVVQLMLDYGATNVNETMYNAAEAGFIDIVKLMLVYKASEIDEALISAATGGHLEIIKYLVSIGAKDYENSIYKAALNGHLEVVQYLVTFKTADADIILYNGAMGGHINIVEYALTKGANDLDNAMLLAIKHDRLNIVQLLSTKGFSNWNEAIEEADMRANDKMIDFLYRLSLT